MTVEVHRARKCTEVTLGVGNNSYRLIMRRILMLGGFNWMKGTAGNQGWLLLKQSNRGRDRVTSITSSFRHR